MECLINAGLNPAVIDKYGKTILNYGSISASLDIVKKILITQYFYNRDNYLHLPWSLLHWACRKGDFEIFKLLSNMGLKALPVLTSEPATLWIPLNIARYCGNINLILSESNILEGCLWLKVISCGIVYEGTELNTVIPALESSLDPSTKVLDIFCNGCFLVGSPFLR